MKEMRIIKFRAWDGETFYYVDLNETEKMFEDVPGYLRKALEIKEKQFFTGLQDKNGKDIYEGDIIEIITDAGRKEKFTVEWGIHRRDMKSGYTVDIPSFSFVNDEKFPTFPIVNNYAGKHDLEMIEVIGNLYEHPNLLK